MDTRQALRAVGERIATTDSAVLSAFQAFERRGASTSEWNTLITRIRDHHEGRRIAEGGIPPGVFADSVSDALDTIEDSAFKERLRILLLA